MTDTYATRRKIDPSRGDHLADGSPNDNDRVEIGPTQLAFREWQTAGLTPPDLAEMRRFRWARLTQALVDRDYGGLLMFDPLNIRYATDTTNMQLWNAHNPFRACLICADGHMVMWEYKNSPFLVTFNPLVKELRSGASFFYSVTGDTGQQDALNFAAQVDEVMRAHAGTNRRLAVDKIMVYGLRALERAGFEVMEGEEVTERTRAIKGPQDIAAMRVAHHACEAAIAEMETFARTSIPHGKTSEDAIWAELHRSNIRRGGEWIETRLLASGPRTNPWFMECGPRIVQNNEIVA
ncbi:MAG: aminopeptidase P family protein, partial [Pseudorhodobacter sp.]|nr:aminopeptidase P family protein [Pseudorhodobacter sp.]